MDSVCYVECLWGFHEGCGRVLTLPFPSNFQPPNSCHTLFFHDVAISMTTSFNEAVVLAGRRLMETHVAACTRRVTVRPFHSLPAARANRTRSYTGARTPFPYPGSTARWHRVFAVLIRQATISRSLLVTRWAHQTKAGIFQKGLAVRCRQESVRLRKSLGRPWRKCRQRWRQIRLSARCMHRSRTRQTCEVDNHGHSNWKWHSRGHC